MAHVTDTGDAGRRHDYDVATGLVARGDRGAIAESRRRPLSTRPWPWPSTSWAWRSPRRAISREPRRRSRARCGACRITRRRTTTSVWCWAGKDGHADAEREFRAAVAADPQYAQAHVNLGQMLAFAHKTDEAAAEFERALAIDPSSTPARQALDTLQRR